VLEILAHREAARRARSWTAADEIRKSLAAHGFRLEDTKTATHAVSESAESAGLSPVTVTLVRE